MSMGNNAGIGNDAMHTDVPEYLGPVTWVDVSRIYEQAARIGEADTAETEDEPGVDPNYHADMRRIMDSRGLFFMDVPAPPAPVKRRRVTMPTPAPLDWPPGFAGELAQFIYRTAPRPVKEVAIVAALGLLAGICGKAWHIPQSGLNLYIVLIARSAVGKEAMHSGISAIIRACARENPMFHKFVDFAEYVSGPALVKACVGNPCFVNVSGELGRKIKTMADARSDSPQHTLQTQLTNLYHKSGPQAIVGGLGYSNTDNNVQSVAGVSYSVIGETTPGTFLESLTKNMTENGFVSRWLVVEYAGERPLKNARANVTPPEAMRRALNNMATQADLLIAKDQSQFVEREVGAGLSLDLFSNYCDDRINESGDDEARRAMWNRAHLKALRVAALLAVADNYIAPVIRQQHADWAINIVHRDIVAFAKRLDSGDVGTGDEARQDKLFTILREYLTQEVPASYKVHPEMKKNDIVPLHYLQKRTARAAAFYDHRFGANRALDDAIGALIAGGYVMEVQRDKVVEGYSYHGKGFRILRLPDPD